MASAVLQRFFGLGRTDRHDDHFLGLAGFLQPQRLFDRDLVERVHRHLDVGKLDAGTVRLHGSRRLTTRFTVPRTFIVAF